MAAKKEDKCTLREKLSACMAEIGYVRKDGNNTQQHYTYLSERAVKEACQAVFVKHGLVPEWIIRIEYASTRAYAGKNGFDAIVHAKIRFTCGESVLTCEGVGMGRDPGDKAVMKAQTAAVRECLKNLFLIVSGDDPEASDPEGGRKVAAKPEPRDIVGEAKATLDEIKRLTTVDAFEKLKMEMPKRVADWPADKTNEVRKVFQEKGAELKRQEGK